MEKTTPFVVEMQKTIPEVTSNVIKDNFTRFGICTKRENTENLLLAVEMQKNIRVLVSQVTKDNFTRFGIHTRCRKCRKRHLLLQECRKTFPGSYQTISKTTSRNFQMKNNIPRIVSKVIKCNLTRFGIHTRCRKCRTFRRRHSSASPSHTDCYQRQLHLGGDE